MNEDYKVVEMNDLDLSIERELMDLRSAYDEVTTSDLQGMASVKANKLMGVTFKERMENKDLFWTASEIEDFMLKFVYDEIALDEAISGIRERV